MDLFSIIVTSYVLSLLIMYSIACFSRICEIVWCWIDDKQLPKKWLLSVCLSLFLKKIYKYHTKNICGDILFVRTKKEAKSAHKKYDSEIAGISEKEIDSIFTLFSFITIVCTLVFVVVVGIMFIPGAMISIIIVCGLLFLARFTRRTQKLLKNHINNKNIHIKDENERH